MALGKALRAAMSGPGSCLLMDEDLPIVSRICQAVISDSSIQNRELHFQKEELVYQLSLPKRRWILVKKMDESSSQTAWVPEFCLSKPQPGPYRVNEYLYGKDVGVSQGEIVQITDVDLWGGWCFQKLDHTRARGLIYPCYLEKADIQTEPPRPILDRSNLSTVISEENRRLRGSIGNQIKSLFGRKTPSAGVDQNDPPAYSP